MSNPYTSQTVSGYNADPPSDDGSATSNNQLGWQKHLDKIGGPLKTAIEAVDAAALSAFGLIFGNDLASQSTNYTITTSDQGQLIEASAALTFTLPAVASAGTGFAVLLLNNSTGAVTVDGNSSETINGVTSIYLGPGETVLVSTDGTEWYGAITRVFPNRVQSKSGNYTVLVTDIGSVIEVTAAATITLPAVGTAGANFKIIVLNTGIGLVTIDGATSETINGATTLLIPPNESTVLFCDGTEWFATATNRDQPKVKTGDETVNNSATLQDDDHLAGYVIKANGYYAISGMLLLTSNTTPDFQIAMNFSQTPAEFLLSMDVGGAATAGILATATPGSGLTVTATGAGNIYLHIKGFIKGHATTDGTMDVQWAQATQDASDTIVYEPSWVTLTPIA